MQLLSKQMFSFITFLGLVATCKPPLLATNKSINQYIEKYLDFWTWCSYMAIWQFFKQFKLVWTYLLTFTQFSISSRINSHHKQTRITKFIKRKSDGQTNINKCRVFAHNILRKIVRNPKTHGTFTNTGWILADFKRQRKKVYLNKGFAVCTDNCTCSHRIWIRVFKWKNKAYYFHK